MDKTITNAELWLKHVALAVRRDFFEAYDIPLRSPPISLAPMAASAGNPAALTYWEGHGGELDPTRVEIDPRMLTNEPSFSSLESGPDGYGFAAALAHELAHVGQRLTSFDVLMERKAGIDTHDAPDFIEHLDRMNLIGPHCCTRPGPEFKAWVDAVVRPAYEAELKEQSHGRPTDTSVPTRRPEAAGAARAEVEEAQGRAA